MNRVAPLAACLLSAAGVAISGCRTTPPAARPDPFEGGRPIAVDDARVTAYLGELRSAAEERRSLVGSARLSLEAPELRFRRPQRLAIRRPADLRIEVLGLFGQIAAILVTDGTRYQLWDGGQERLEQGDVSPELLWRVARVDLSPAEVVDLLLGAPSVAQDLAPVAAAETPAGGIAVVLGLDPAADDLLIEFDRAGRVTRALRRVSGRLLWEAVFTDYRDLGEQLFAHKIAIDFPRFDARVAFEFDSAELNRELSSDVFTLELPGERSAEAR